MIKKPCEAGQNKGVDRCAKYYFCWIPAFAGMTGLMENLGSTPHFNYNRHSRAGGNPAVKHFA
jgi:hypothetical protein